MHIPQRFTPILDIALDTLDKGKQAIVFANTKRSAEKQAEDIAKKLEKKEVLEQIAEKVRKTLSPPTKQCERLAFCIARGTAFHHAGLHQKQRDIIEDSFKAGAIKIICSTPTLAAGVDLPAFRTILASLKRYTHRGLDYIPVLEYLQMAGRAGRPSYDSEGEAICIAKDERQKEELTERYILGEPEAIYSKLAAEPVLRTYVLSLLVTKVVRTREELLNFFSQTFFGHQFEDLERIDELLGKVLLQLEDWEFLHAKKDDFISANELQGAYKPTLLGKRVAELYLDPYTAHQLVERLKKDEKHDAFAYVQAFSQTLEMRPLIRVKKKEIDYFEGVVEERREDLLEEEPYDYDEHDFFLNSVKTASCLYDWMEEKNDEYLLEKYDVRPGELRAKLTLLDWLVYTGQEISKILLLKNRNELAKLRVRVKQGVKEELLPLVKLQNIGRVRARKLFNADIKNAKDLRNASPELVKKLLGKNLGEKIQHQLTFK